ncbi:hypothetical protein BC830DRAFT_1198599, partial [Chytriomyces sp. MP71]
TNYHGTTHPSQPNYWSTIAQSTFRGIVDPSSNKTINGDNGDNSYNLTGAPHIGDSLEAAGLNWAIFSENYPGNATNCFIEPPLQAQAQPLRFFRLHLQQPCPLWCPRQEL